MTKTIVFTPVAIHSVPRSGSSWLGQIVNSSPTVVYKYQPLFSYAFKDRLSPNSTRLEIETFFNEIAETSDPFLDQIDAVERGIYPKFKKDTSFTHVAYKEVRYHHILENLLTELPSIRLIGIVRSPLGVLASWKSAPKEFHADWDFEREWRNAISKNNGRPEEFYGFEKWKWVAALFLDFEQRFPDRFQLVRYRNLIDRPFETCKSIFEFLNLSWNDQTARFLGTSRTERRSDPYSVFHNKTKDDAWKSVLPESIINAIYDELTGTSLETFLDDFE